MTGPSDLKAPFIIPPLSSHTHTIIALHGRGSQGPEFAEELFETPTSTNSTLEQRFPHCRWVFPTSQERFSTVFREKKHEWFDIRSLTDPAMEENLQVEGLRDSISFLSKVIGEETALVGSSSRVILLGLSQGCATGLLTLRAGNLRLGAFMGLSGWMPFKTQIEETVPVSPGEKLKGRLVKFFETTFGIEIQTQKSEGRQEIFETPVFLGHFTDDEYVNVKEGQEIGRVLIMMEMNVVWEKCEIGGHEGFLETEGLDRIAKFLINEVGLGVT